MGYYLKNRKLESGSTSVVVPSGSTATRPDSPIFGQFRFNTDSGLLEFFNGTIFQTLSPGGSVNFTVDDFDGNGSDTVFTMSVVESNPAQIIVFVGSIYQIPTTNYTVDGGFDITFSSAPPNGIKINVIHNDS